MKDIHNLVSVLSKWNRFEFYDFENRIEVAVNARNQQFIHRDEGQYCIAKLVEELLKKQGWLCDLPNEKELEQRVTGALKSLPKMPCEPLHLELAKSRCALRCVARKEFLNLVNGVPAAESVADVPEIQSDTQNQE